MANGPEKTRLEAALHALGREHTESDGTKVNVTFEEKGAPGHTTVNADDKGNISSFNVNFNPSAIGGMQDMAVDAAHEGTHITNYEDPRYGAGQLSDFSDEYRAYQTSAWAGQALGSSSVKPGGNEIWNSSWAAADRQTLMDKGITNEVTGHYGYKETEPHNPWSD